MRADRVRDHAIDVGVVVLALGFAAVLFAGYDADPDGLWRGVYHDRNSHYAYGLDIALSVRSFDIVGFLSEIERAKVWPPLHGLVLAAVLLVGGLDHRLAVVPGLAGFAMTIAFTWLIARRLFADRLLGMTAGAIAVGLILASPAFRMISTDVMLEGLGAGLSAMALWAFVRAYEKPQSRRRWLLLALTLSALFFHKGNYWGLVVAALALTALGLGRDRVRTAFASHAPKTIAGLSGFARRMARDPLIATAAVILVGVSASAVLKPEPVRIFGRDLGLYPPHNLLTVGYALLFARLATAWWKHRPTFDAALGVAGRPLFYWHAVPIAIWFLLPKQLGVFLWFVGPANNPGGASALTVYGSGFLEGFSPSAWLGTLVLALFVVALAWRDRLIPETRVVLVFAVLATIAVMIHPQHQARFLSTFLFAVWLGAGAGAAILVGVVTRGAATAVRGLVAAGVVLSVAGALALTRPNTEVAAAFAIRTLDGPSDLDLIAAFAPYVDGLDRVAIAATFGDTRLFDWPLKERCRCKLLWERLWMNPGTREEAARAAVEWLRRSQARRAVIIDLPRSPNQIPAVGWTYDRLVGIVDAIGQQDRFRSIAEIAVPAFGGRIIVLQRQ